MLNFIRKHILHIIVGIGLLTALLVYSFNLPRASEANLVERAVGNILAPVQREVFRVAYFPLLIWENYVALVNVRRENQRLKMDVRELNSRLASAEEARLENERLNALMNLHRTIREQAVTAHVIGEDVTPWFRTLTIDRGSRDGLRDGMPVLAVGGVVGQTVKVAANSSRVMLLTDNASGIAAVIQRSRARGVVKGKGDNLCSLEFSMRGEDVQVGDQVITSGIGGIFPKGALIGEVTMVKKGEYGVFQTVTIRPAVNSARLEEVLVLLRTTLE